MLSYGAVAGLLLALPAMVGAILEPPLFILADRYPRKPFIVGGLVAMAAGLVLAGAAWMPWVFAAAMACWYLGSGCAVGLSQASLMDAQPEVRERTMARWGFMSGVGDLAAPLLVAATAWLGLGWRVTFVACGLLVLVYGLVLARREFPVTARRRRIEGTPGALRAISAALRNRRLLLWLSACWLCGLLDEVFIVFAALRLGELGVDPSARALILGCFSLGLLPGLVVAERLLERLAPLRLLGASAAGCGCCYGLWMTTTDPVLSGALLLLVGFFCAPLYPIAKARAYRALPDGSGMVNAVGNLFTPASVALPLLLGLVAERWGLAAALWLLMAQPLGLWLMATRRARNPRTR